MEFASPTTEHRGIFKNPFNEIRDQFKNIAMKLHGWAGTVEKNIFNKTYMALFPNPIASYLLYRSIKPGDMYIGTDKCPASFLPSEEEIRKKYPSIKDELIGIKTCPTRGPIEKMHISELKVLSKYYTAE